MCKLHNARHCSSPRLTRRCLVLWVAHVGVGCCCCPRCTSRPVPGSGCLVSPTLMRMWRRASGAWWMCSVLSVSCGAQTSLGLQSSAGEWAWSPRCPDSFSEFLQQPPQHFGQHATVDLQSSLLASWPWPIIRCRCIDIRICSGTGTPKLLHSSHCPCCRYSKAVAAAVACGPARDPWAAQQQQQQGQPPDAQASSHQQQQPASAMAANVATAAGLTEEEMRWVMGDTLASLFPGSFGSTAK